MATVGHCVTLTHARHVGNKRDLVLKMFEPDRPSKRNPALPLARPQAAPPSCGGRQVSAAHAVPPVSGLYIKNTQK